MPRIGYSCITVNDDVHKKLTSLKKKFGCKTIPETISLLIKQSGGQK